MVAPLVLTNYIILESMCRLGVALSQMIAEEMALRTFVLMRSEMFPRSLSWQRQGPQSFGANSRQYGPLS